MNETELLAGAFLAGVVCTLTVVRWVTKAKANGWSWPPSSKRKKGNDQ